MARLLKTVSYDFNGVTFDRYGAYTINVRVEDDDSGIGGSVRAAILIDPVDRTLGPPLYDVAYDPATDMVLTTPIDEVYRMQHPELLDGDVLQLPVRSDNDPDFEIGLEIVPVEFRLNETDVPAGSLLVIDSRGPTDHLIAMNPETGEVLEDFDLETERSLVGGTYDVSTDLIVALSRANTIVTIDPETGSVVGESPAPFDLSGSSGTTIVSGDITSLANGNIYVASNAEPTLYEYPAGGGPVRAIDMNNRGFGTDLSGLAFNNLGQLIISTTERFLVFIDMPEIFGSGEGEAVAETESFAPSSVATSTATSNVIDAEAEFVPLDQHVTDAVAAGPATGLTNSDFTVTDPSSSEFAWTTVGDVAIADGTATISEDVGMVSDLSQTFVIPDGVNTITFTLGGVSLDVGGSHPPEAFEVALLDANSTVSLLSEMEGMAGGDALLNVGADGEVYFADTVRVDGVAASGETVDLATESIDVTVPIPAAMNGNAATLYFDLIGFGDDASSVNVSNIQLSTRGTGWQNPVDRYDVTDKDGITAADALAIINELHRVTVHDRITGELVEITDTVGPPPFYDVNGDGRVSAIDAIQVLNKLNRDGLGNGGELPDSWQNVDMPTDVDADGLTQTNDAFVIINELKNPKIHNPFTLELPLITADVRPAPYLDVNGDGSLTVIDALRVINELSRPQQSEPELNDEALLDLLDDV